MTSNFYRPLVVGVATAMLIAAPAAAQTTTEAVAAHTDWSVFVADAPKECYLSAEPANSVAKRGGSVVEVNRGDIRVFVTFRPGENVTNEVSFTGGYPLREGSTVRVEVGSDTYELNIGSGEANGWAWPASPEEDQRIVDAMRNGANAKITGVSSRGTTTEDTFSLMGFTAAMTDAEGRCK